MPFDERKARRAVNFFQGILKHTKGKYAGKPFTLLPWQHEIISNVFGTVTDAGLRQYREVYLEVGKKQGKSELAAGIALTLLIIDEEEGAEIYGAAASRDQAGIVFGVAAAMVERSPILKKYVRVLRSTKLIIKHDDPSSFYKAIAADGDLQDGVNPHGVIIDELHRWKQEKSKQLYEVLTRGGMARSQPLVWQITTAGVPDEAPLCYPKHQYALNMEKGIIKDPQFYGRVFGCEPEEVDGDLWQDEKLWARCNPSLDVNGGFMPIEVMRQLALKAKNDPTQLPDFKRYHLNVWGQHEQRALDLIEWDRCAVDLKPLYRRRCFAGIDCAQKIDLASLVLIFPDEDNESFDVLPFFWMAKDNLRRAGRRDKVPYEHWASAGALETCEGNIIDQAVFERKLLWAAENFDLQEIGYDYWHMTEFAMRMTDMHGMTFVPIRQGFQSMSEPTKKVIELVKGQRLRHAGHPLLRWNADCVTLRGDGNDNVMPVKPERQNSDKRIDGMVALIMATDRAIRNGYGVRSVYEDRGLLYA